MVIGGKCQKRSCVTLVVAYSAMGGTGSNGDWRVFWPFLNCDNEANDQYDKAPALTRPRSTRACFQKYFKTKQLLYNSHQLKTSTPMLPNMDQKSNKSMSDKIWNSYIAHLQRYD